MLLIILEKSFLLSRKSRRASTFVSSEAREQVSIPAVPEEQVGGQRATRYLFRAQAVNDPRRLTEELKAED